MANFNSYRDRFRNIALERGADGVLLVRLHTRGGPFKWGARDDESVHAQLGDAFYQIARDTENKVMILTGTGDEFLTSMDEEDGFDGAYTPEVWDRLGQEGRDILVNYLDIGALVISAVNGPATFHAELPTLADIVIASDTAAFADPHMQIGAVPGDGVHVWWPMLLGPNRGRSFLLTGEVIDAQEALRLGFVSEVLPLDQVLPRARELASAFAQKPALTLRHTRSVLTQELKRRLLNDLGYGFALESLAALSSHDGS